MVTALTLTLMASGGGGAALPLRSESAMMEFVIAAEEREVVRVSS